MRALIEASADIKQTWHTGVTTLFIAAQNGHEAVVRALIEAGVARPSMVLQARRRWTSPLITATRRSFKFSKMPAPRCDDGNAGVYCSQTGWKQTAHASEREETSASGETLSDKNHQVPRFC